MLLQHSQELFINSSIKLNCEGTVIQNPNLGLPSGDNYRLHYIAMADFSSYTLNYTRKELTHNVPESATRKELRE